MALERVARDCLPMRVEDITKEADNFDFYRELPIKTWLRTAKLLLTQADACERQRDLQTAYLYNYRHAQLLARVMKTYTAAEKQPHRSDLDAAVKKISSNLTKLESWRPLINENYERETRALEAYRASRTNDTRVISHRQQKRTSGKRSSLEIDWSPDDHYGALPKSPGYGNAYSSQVQQRPVDDDQSIVPESLVTAEDMVAAAHEVSNLVQSTRRLLDGRTSGKLPSPARRNIEPQFRYPEAPAREQEMIWTLPSASVDPLDAPRRPPKLHQDRARSDSSLARASGLPYTIRSHATTEGGRSLRTVRLPSSVKQTFLNLVDGNTARNIETCGVLLAELVSNELIVTHLAIPDQTGSSDMCDTTDDGDAALVDYCDKTGLMTCGWIHTHPSQSCFLSSRDMHTSGSYQQLLPESIAIVCAPRQTPDYGIFRLTDPPGLPAIIRCTQKAAFHPHDEPHLYTEATSPGHVVEDLQTQIHVVDLRTQPNT